jgi:thioesterase domain-containing protein
MAPRKIIVVDALPRLANGKLDLRALPEPEAPRISSLEDPQQMQVAALAAEAMHMAPPGAHDNLLDLGCDSLALAAILARLPVQIAIASFLRNPTVAGIVAAMRDSTASLPGCIVPLHPSGSRPPLFCFPGVDGEAGGWIQLTRSLGADQPVYSLRVRGFEASGPGHLTLTEVAAGLTDAIQRIRPDQPAFLFAYSAGGILAQECARQLQRLGRELGPLILIDTLDLGAYRRGWQFWRKVNMRLGRLGRRRRGVSLANSREPARSAIAESMRRAIRRHRPGAYSGSAIFFRPSDTEFLVPMDRIAPWRDLILGGVEVQVITGDHLSLVSTAGTEEIARNLQSKIR